MKKHLLLLLLIAATLVEAQNHPLPEKYTPLPFGSVLPSGWIKTQMEKDMAGFVGNLDRLVPALMSDSIYGTERLTHHSKVKDLGNLKEGDVGGDDQYKWWNSETQSNWWDGYIRYALLLNDQAALRKVNHYLARMLATQDEDGYIGIYDRELRYKFKDENGELWSKTTLYRGLLAYYEATHDTLVWHALVQAVDNVMQNYPINQSHPFDAGKSFSGGVAHGLTFTDVLDKMYLLSGKQKYHDYAAFLYNNFSQNYTSEKDVQLASILDSTYKLQSHGVHTYEHLRPLIVATYATGDPELKKALDIYRTRIRQCTTPAGGAIGDEWIAGRMEDATNTGYEYCSLQELMDSYSVLFQKSGDLQAAEAVENIFYNAAQGSRNPEHSAIAYLKTDNSYEMLGSRNGEIEPDRNQTRYKYSPVHQDVAVCCVPNAGRITPYFLHNCWLAEGENTFVAAVLGPNILQTMVGTIPIRIEEKTDYPFTNHVVFKITSKKPVSLRLKIRKPAWATSVITQQKYSLEDGFLVFKEVGSSLNQIELEFKTDVKVLEGTNNDKYFKYGALVYALPMKAKVKTGKKYAEGFEDFYYAPQDSTRYAFIPDNQARFQDGKVHLRLKNTTTKKVEQVKLVPLGSTILRQAAFK